MVDEDNIKKIKNNKKHKLEDECILGNNMFTLTTNNVTNVDNDIYFNEKKKKKIDYLLNLNTSSNNYNIFKNSDIVCNLLSFLTFSERWKFKLLNKSFYKAFNTKYAWTNLDFRFIDVDLFKFDFFRKYNKLFINTYSLSLSINGTENVEVTINLIIKNFKYLKDLRLYFRKKNTNFIYEGVHPVVSNILNCKTLKENKKEINENKKNLVNSSNYNDRNNNNNNNSSDKNSNNNKNNNNNDLIKKITDEKKEYEKKNKDNENYDTYSENINEKNNKNENYKLYFNEKSDKKNGTTSKDDKKTNKDSFLNNPSNNNKEKEKKTKLLNDDKNTFSLKTMNRGNNDDISMLSCDFIDSDLEINKFFLENYYYKYIHHKNEIKDDTKADELLQKYMRITESKKKLKTQNLEIRNSFENLERLILDVELKGEDLLCFVGKLNNLKDIIISKLLYSNKLNRSQNIIIFTCFIEKMKQNNIRLIQLGLYFRSEYKPIDYLNNEKFRRILSERKEYVYDINKEEGDELIHILQKNHLNSLYCLWSNDLFISFEMYEQIKKFHNLKIWILPGWRALSLAKQ